MNGLQIKGIYNDYLNQLDATQATKDAYRKSLRQFEIYLTDNGITAPQRADIIAYRDYLTESGRKPATVQAYTVALKQFFKFTEQAGVYPDVSAGVKGVKLSREHKKDPLTATQAGEILKQMERETPTDKRDYAILLLMVTTGLRTIEVIRADADDLKAVGNDTVLFIQGKGKTEKAEYVKIPQAVEQALRDYLKVKTPGKALFTSNSNRNKGGRLTTRTVRGIIKNIFRESGFDNDRLTAHSLRHTTATLALLNGSTLQETQQLLRHTNINTTLIYAHNLTRAGNQSEQRVCDAILTGD